jgi:hypothetical protein
VRCPAPMLPGSSFCLLHTARGIKIKNRHEAPLHGAELLKERKLEVEREINKLPIYHGRAWRVHYESMDIPRSATAADVIRFEREELGNEDNVSPEALAALDHYRAKDTLWVTKKREDAAEYLSEGRPKSDIQEFPEVDGGRIIADDGQGGYLVLLPYAEYMAERENKEGAHG